MKKLWIACTALVVLLLPAIAVAEEPHAGLFYRTSHGLEALPSLHNEVQLDVGGITVHASYVQRFENTAPETIEAIYVFPLPDGAAVHHMEFRIDDRIVVSEVQEKQKAQATYQRAKRAGKKAALVEQERPNLFTASVANINAGEVVEVRMEYVDEVDVRDRAFEVVVPLTFTPRFSPPSSVQVSRVQPPFQPDYAPTAPTASFQATVTSGLRIYPPTSDTHRIQVEQDGETWRVEPVGSTLLAHRDIVLRWELVEGSSSQLGLIRETTDDGTYGLLMLMPPALESLDDVPTLPTETLFIVDVSGSMDGPSIQQAREALRAAIDRLDPADRFNLLCFNESNRAFRDDFVPADDRWRADAIDWIDDLTADGGTMIYPALLRGLSMFDPLPLDQRNTVSRRILFMTDGAVSNEAEMLQRVADGLGEIRLHALGIGHAPNRYLMHELARQGGGICRFVGSTAQAENEIDGFFTALARPVLTDLRLDWGNARVEAFPSELPDLHAGEPLFVSVRAIDGDLPVWVELEGLAAGEPWRHRVDLTTTSGSGVSQRWARAKVRSLMDQLQAGAARDEIRRAVVDVGLAHRLVTPFTSLVAVEKIVTADGAARPVRVPNAIPRGSQLLNAGLPKGGTDGPLRTRVGWGLLLLAIVVATPLARGGRG